MPKPRHSRECFANHLAAHWLIEPDWTQRLFAQIRATGLPRFGAFGRASEFDEDGDEAEVPQVAATRNGVCVVSIDGPMAKFDSSLGGTNTVRVRAAIRAAAADPAVGAIVVRADSPGGTVDGTKELADDIAAADQAKPVYGFAEDLTASAAYWCLAQCRKLFANATAMIGSIGVFTVLYDQSKQFEAEGIQTVLIGSGGMKGVGAPGLAITDEQKAYLQGLIDDRTQFFVKAIADGRRMKQADVRALADGRVHVAAKAKALGLIDDVQTFDEVMALAAKSAGKAAGASRRTRMAAEIDIEAAQG